MEQPTNKWATYAGYLITGAGIGAALGVLYAPRSGRETRREMSLWLRERKAAGRVEYQAMREALARGRKNILSKVKVDSAG